MTISEVENYNALQLFATASEVHNKQRELDGNASAIEAMRFTSIENGVATLRAAYKGGYWEKASRWEQIVSKRIKNYLDQYDHDPS